MLNESSSYKPSRFNFIYWRSDNECIIYNTYSKAIVELTKDEFNQLQELSLEEPQIVKELMDNGIVVNSSFDEVGFMSYCHNTTKYAKESLHLVLAVTMDCNFSCPYCYENRRKGYMNKDVQSAVIDFIEKSVKNGVHMLDITWYGGEPLLYPDIIENMAIKIRQIADETNCELSMYMVTNGYLLTPKIVELIDRLGIVKVQITIDGLKDNHDKRRCLNDGSGTYDIVLKNLKLFEEYSIRVDVRMNVDNENCKDFLALRETLQHLENPNVVLYPSPVEDINPDTNNEVSDFMSFDEFERFADDICTEHGSTLALTKVLDDRYCYCQAETESSYVIDELGNCYKCWDQVGRVENSCFNIADPLNKNYNNIVSFMGWDPFRDEKCSKCVFLPICFGGCKFHRMNFGRYDCGFSERSMKNYIENTFFNNT